MGTLGSMGTSHAEKHIGRRPEELCHRAVAACLFQGDLQDLAVCALESPSSSFRDVTTPAPLHLVVASDRAPAMISKPARLSWTVATRAWSLGKPFLIGTLDNRIGAVSVFVEGCGPLLAKGPARFGKPG
mmetsp:Transcript_83188/g.165122  ORF Transcript_83188/g.165122 Transcript_83188/m.165122 type:complete len:130 (+) Transcript_83188:162-551(+)